MPARKKAGAVVTVPQYGTYSPDYRPGFRQQQAQKAVARQASFDALPEAEKQRRRNEWTQYQADMEQWRRIFDKDGPEAAAEWLNSRRPMPGASEQKPSDQDARSAVEGDTAMDDALFEEGGE